MKVQMQMAIDMIEAQAGGSESLELGVDFGAQLRPQFALEKNRNPALAGSRAEFS